MSGMFALATVFGLLVDASSARPGDATPFLLAFGFIFAIWPVQLFARWLAGGDISSWSDTE